MPKHEQSTIKVSYKNVGRWQEQEPPTDWTGEERIIDTGPLYPPEDIHALLKKGCSSSSLFTEKCKLDVAEDGLSLQDVIELLSCVVTHGKYKNSQWCRQGEIKSHGADKIRKFPCAACDAYTISVIVEGEGTKHYYAKFAISAMNTLLLIFSCHQ